MNSFQIVIDVRLLTGEKGQIGCLQEVFRGAIDVCFRAQSAQ